MFPFIQCHSAISYIDIDRYTNQRVCVCNPVYPTIRACKRDGKTEHARARQILQSRHIVVIFVTPNFIHCRAAACPYL